MRVLLQYWWVDLHWIYSSYFTLELHNFEQVSWTHHVFDKITWQKFSRTHHVFHKITWQKFSNCWWFITWFISQVISWWLRAFKHVLNSWKVSMILQASSWVLFQDFYLLWVIHVKARDHTWLLFTLIFQVRLTSRGQTCLRATHVMLSCLLQAIHVMIISSISWD